MPYRGLFLRAPLCWQSCSVSSGCLVRRWIPVPAPVYGAFVDIVCTWQWHVLCWFCWCAVRAVFQLVVEMPCIMAGMDQKGRYAPRCRAHRRFLQWHVLVLLMCAPFPSVVDRPRCSAPEGLLCGELLYVPVEWSCRFSGAVVLETVVLPHLQLVEKKTPRSYA